MLFYSPQLRGAFECLSAHCFHSWSTTVRFWSWTFSFELTALCTMLYLDFEAATLNVFILLIAKGFKVTENYSIHLSPWMAFSSLFWLFGASLFGLFQYWHVSWTSSPWPHPYVKLGESHSVTWHCLTRHNSGLIQTWARKWRMGEIKPVSKLSLMP